jgi:hypothetical protein
MQKHFQHYINEPSSATWIGKENVIQNTIEALLAVQSDLEDC